MGGAPQRLMTRERTPSGDKIDSLRVDDDDDDDDDECCCC